MNLNYSQEVVSAWKSFIGQTPVRPAGMEFNPGHYKDVYVANSSRDLEGYNVYRNGSFLASTTNTSYDDGTVAVEEDAQSIKERKNISVNGFIEATILITKKGKMYDKPLLTFMGLPIYQKEEFKYGLEEAIEKTQADATMIYVTHDQVEAMTMADRIMVLSEGKLEQFGTPMDLYHRPKSKFVAGFIGHPKMNFISTTCLSTDSFGLTVELPVIGKQLLPVESPNANRDEDIELGVRPEDFILSETGKGLPFKVEVLERLGGSTLVYGTLDKYPNFCAMLQGDADVHEGELVNLDVNPANFHVFDSKGIAMMRREVPEILE